MNFKITESPIHGRVVQLKVSGSKARALIDAYAAHNF